MRLGALFTVWVVNLSRKCKAHIKAGSAQVVCERAQVHSHLDFDSNRNNFKVQRLKCDLQTNSTTRSKGLINVKKFNFKQNVPDFFFTLLRVIINNA